MTAVLASARGEIAGYVATVLSVYSLILIAYLLTTIYFSFGGRVPYNPVASAILGFLRDVSEPYLRIFRRLIPPLGPLDLSPILALLALGLVGGAVTRLIAG